MADNVEVLDGSVGKNNTMVYLMIGFLDFAFFKKFLNALPVLTMNPAKVEFSTRRILARFDAESFDRFPAKL